MVFCRASVRWCRYALQYSPIISSEATRYHSNSVYYWSENVGASRHFVTLISLIFRRIWRKIVIQSSDWGLFLSVTLSWGMLHAVDGWLKSTMTKMRTLFSLVLVALHSKLLEETISMLTKVWTRQFNKLQPSNSLNIEWTMNHRQNKDAFWQTGKAYFFITFGRYNADFFLPHNAGQTSKKWRRCGGGKKYNLKQEAERVYFHRGMMLMVLRGTFSFTSTEYIPIWVFVVIAFELTAYILTAFSVLCKIWNEC